MGFFLGTVFSALGIVVKSPDPPRRAMREELYSIQTTNVAFVALQHITGNNICATHPSSMSCTILPCYLLTLTILNSKSVHHIITYTGR